MAAIVVSALAAAVAIVDLYLTALTATVQIINRGTTPDEARFEPNIITVQERTTVVWKNTDASAHTVTARSGAFDSGVMGPGGDFAFTFAEKGTFEYYCKIHPVMVGAVQVQ